MKVILLKKEILGITDLRKHKDDYLILENVLDFNQILTGLSSVGINRLDYKYCSLSDSEDIPFLINVQNDIFNQMQTFKFYRVRYSELNISNDEKKALIERVVKDDMFKRTASIESKAIKLIVKKEFGKDVKKKLSKLADEMDKIESDMSNINYKDYLNEFI